MATAVDQVDRISIPPRLSIQILGRKLLYTWQKPINYRIHKKKGGVNVNFATSFMMRIRVPWVGTIVDHSIPIAPHLFQEFGQGFEWHSPGKAVFSVNPSTDGE
jgi:hypothetical protein